MLKTLFIILTLLIILYVLYRMFLKPSRVSSESIGLPNSSFIGSWVAVEPKNPTKITFYENGTTDINFATPSYGGTYTIDLIKNFSVYGKNIKSNSPYSATYYLIGDIDSDGQFILSSSGFMNTEVVKVLMKKVNM